MERTGRILETVEHNERDCCDLWKQQLISGRLCWRSQDCQAIAYPSNAVAEAALRGNQLGVTFWLLIPVYSNEGNFDHSAYRFAGAPLYPPAPSSAASKCPASATDGGHR